MKKFIASILLVSVMLMTMIIPASAAGGEISATAILSKDKTSFTVSVAFNNNPGIIAVTADAAFDSKVLKLKSVKSGEIFESPYMTSENLSVTPYRVIWMNATAGEDVKTNGVLATYTFEVLKNAPIGESEIKFDIIETVNYAGDMPEFKGCSFKINVKNNSAQSTPDSQTNVSSNANASDAVTNEQTLEVEKPEFDNTASDVENAKPDGDNPTSNDSEIGETIGSDTDVEIDMEAEDSFDETDDNKDGKDDDNNRTLITILTIAIILILGGAITFVAIYVRKKSAQNKN